MNFIRTSILFLLVAFTFLGNVGFSVFTHTCKKDGISRSFFIQQNHQCEQHQEESLPPCCKKKVIKDDNCCNDEVDVVKIKLDFHNDYHPTIETLCFNLPSIKFRFKERYLEMYQQNIDVLGDEFTISRDLEVEEYVRINFNEVANLYYLVPFNKNKVEEFDEESSAVTGSSVARFNVKGFNDAAHSFDNTKRSFAQATQAFEQAAQRLEKRLKVHPKK